MTKRTALKWAEEIVEAKMHGQVVPDIVDKSLCNWIQFEYKPKKAVQWFREFADALEKE